MAEKKKLRIAFARFMQESNSFSPVDSYFKDFNYSEGEELMERCQRKRKWEIDGFLRNLELSGFMRAVKQRKNKVEAVPLFSPFESSS